MRGYAASLFVSKEEQRLPIRHQMVTKLMRNPMRTTINLDDALLAEAQRLTGETERTSLIREGLRALIERESARRLAALGGSAPDLEDIPRRRSSES